MFRYTPQTPCTLGPSPTSRNIKEGFLFRLIGSLLSLLLLEYTPRSSIVPDIIEIMLWKRFDLAVELGSGYDDSVLLALLLRNGDPSFVLRLGYGFDLRTVTAVTVVWLHMKDVQFVACPASSIVDEHVVVLAFFCAPDVPSVVHSLRVDTGFEPCEVSFADAHIPGCCARFDHRGAVFPCLVRERHIAGSCFGVDADQRGL